MAGLRWGCVADDFTGASDLASFLVNNGVRTLLICGEPQENQTVPEEIQAIVVALKSRTAPTPQAVEQVGRVFEWLRLQSCEKFYFKYCSTFDSTDTGNIGPVIDALLDSMDLPYTILCPALLVNGRKVKDGKLYVNGVLLEESGMRNHPLTPMRHSELKFLIERQSRYKCLALTHEDYAQGDGHIRQRIARFAKEHGRFTISVDFFEPEHGQLIMKIFEDLTVLTGASGIMEDMAAVYWPDSGAGAQSGAYNHMPKGPRLLLAGSCSDMTKKQIRRYKDANLAFIEIDPHLVLTGAQTAESVWNKAREMKAGDILIYTAGARDDEKGAESRSYGGEEVSALLEALMGGLACMATGDGYEKIVAAGGETSGAIVSRLGYREFHVAESVDPGVPVLIPIRADHLRVVLKSGNFGGEDFFLRALREEANTN